MNAVIEAYKAKFNDKARQEQSNELIVYTLPLPELIINTTYLMDNWVCGALTHIHPGFSFHKASDINMTEEQRFYYLMGFMICMDEEPSRLHFYPIRQAYMLKGLMNKLPAKGLVDEAWKVAKRFDAQLGQLLLDEDDKPRDIGGFPENEAELTRFLGIYFDIAIYFCCACISGYVEAHMKQSANNK